MFHKLSELPDSSFVKTAKFEKTAAHIEKSILNATIGIVPKEHRSWDDPIFKRTYARTFRKVLANLFQNPCSEIIREKIKNRLMKVTDIASMSFQELNPGILIEAKQMYDKLLFVGKLSETMKQNIEESKGLFRCGRCRSEKTTYHLVQCRSSDEGATTFVTCLRCNNKWRFN